MAEADVLGRLGVWVLAKRLDQGRFAWPTAADERRKLALTPEAFALLTSGVKLEHGLPWPW